MANKVYPDFNIVLGDYNGFKRVCNIMLLTNSKEIFLQVRDYYNGNLLDGGLCFKLREFTWFLNHCIVKRNPTALWASKLCEIYYECDKLTGNFINVYQRTNTRRSIFVFHRNEVQNLFNRRNEITAHARDWLERSPASTTEISKTTNESSGFQLWIDEPMDISVEPQTIELQ